MRLALVQHGDSDQSIGTLSCDSPTRGLTADGWVQVTRTAWSLRAHPEYAPSVVLTGTGQRCADTAKRLRSVADDAENDSTDKGKPYPEARISELLDEPRRLPLRAAEAIGAQVEAVTAAAGPQKKSTAPPPPGPVLLVAGGTAIEGLLACLTVQGSRHHAVAARLGGGDAVLLESPPMCLIGTSEDGDERVRPAAELWEEALHRDSWKIEHHFRGDGRRLATNLGDPDRPSEEKMSLEEQLALNELRPQEDGLDLGATWRRFAGEPLVLSNFEFSQICKRAGSPYYFIDRQVTNSMGLCVHDYAIPAREDDPLFTETEEVHVVGR